MEFSQKQIWLVNFDPAFGHEYRKVRPALIIQDTKYINIANLLTVVPISSKVDKRIELDVLLPKDKNNRLVKDSLVKTYQISSFDKRRFIKYVGICNDKVFKSIQKNVKAYLSLSIKRRKKKKSVKMPGG
ncbi:MAG: type II toxin-antitoxin system PemK/MazF family toxin [Candidatus Aminicenantes bacterium]|nr:type II toxin-antitoxin system PemK/MazF family toxin [Candidatus Aminicenantes bacterium]NIM81081.1 type II toxin-antitoxin system PemK/MazF family toxin [Candidatus Aminicenantes bacterium]NIN20458.1 type II toxin-antitoxin system PemK/MazF family toxin [Candidatus Aminicenantes bacterium]NIN44231.1 type II toxin-antitoxin system PemK/MazF family toxin [Candidatus Aminicenantes bacterium]NIN87050.1 type II toxin-antitoxin system PemK/MazF family toxin [Candidatus Aminicenantes bacterium]